jgi:outer membrane lipoprotein-sorting protein
MRPFLTALFAAVLLALPAVAQALTPAEVLARADAIQQADTAHILMEQTITTTSGATRTFRIESWAAGSNEKSVMRFISPAPSAGIGMLSLEGGDVMWAYFPDSDDLRKIASSARNGSMEGSDFSYEDMSGGSWGDDWEATDLVDEELGGRACHKLTATPRGNSSYSKMVAWVDAETFVTHRVHYFDRKGNHVKTLEMTGWEEIGGTWTPREMVMHNLKRGSQTAIRMIEVAYGVEVDDKLFTTDFLTSM